jgi:chromosome partitioning protein
VLVIDLDPQASGTSFFGLAPETHVKAEQTLFALFQGEETSVEYAVQQTYWPGIDLIAANAGMHGADFILSARQGQEKGFEFWDVLNHGLEAARGDYDVIILDTPPSLSFTAINGLMAADGFIMPLPPKAIDFAASAQFWDLFYEMVKICKSPGRVSKRFAFIDVVLSMVDSSDSATDIVREWIIGAYGEKVLPVEIPKTSAASTASKNFGSVYDLMLPSTSTERNVANSRTFKRAFEAYERLVDLIEGQVQDFWMMQTMEVAA